MNEDQKLLIYLNTQKDLHVWEKNNLPTANTNAGYELFIYISITAIQSEEIRLKNIYHSLSYSEKTLRLLLNDLKENGWIKEIKKVNDMRYRGVIPTQKFLIFWICG